MLTNLTEPWLSLKNKYGSVHKLCAMIGVTPRTFHHWIHGTRRPRASGKRLLDLFLEAHDLPPFKPLETNHENIPKRVPSPRQPQPVPHDEIWPD